MHEFLLSQTNMWPISFVVTPSASISASHSRKAPFIAQRDLLKVIIETDDSSSRTTDRNKLCVFVVDETYVRCSNVWWRYQISGHHV